jgi:hypothetical protein
MQKKYRRLLTLSLMVPLIYGCIDPVVVDTFCLHAAHIDHLDDDEYLNDIHARKLQAQVKYGMQKCGWQ